MSAKSDPLLPSLPAPLAFRVPPGRSRLVVEGPDASDFLQRLSTQDVQGLAVGAAAPAAFLNPKGRLEAVAVVGREAELRFVVAVADASREHLRTLLDRYHFTERLTLEAPAEEVAELVGFGAFAAAGVAAGTSEVGGCTVLASARFGVERVTAFGSAEAVGSWRSGVEASVDGGELGEWPGAWSELLRLRSGDVAPAVDFDERTIGLEAYLDDHVSATKGCYTGQEIVARIHTYGHVNRRIVLLRIDGEGAIERNTPLCETDEGDAVGRVTSASDVPGSGFRLALGYVPNAFVASGTTLRLGDATGPGVQVLDFEPA